MVRDKRLNILLSAEEKAVLEAATGITPTSTWARRRLLVDALVMLGKVSASAAPDLTEAQILDLVSK